jgi:hypothetical protein
LGGAADDRLLELALSRPNEAMAAARAMLADAPGVRDASIAHQVIGLVLREFGDIEASIAELRVAQRLAARAGSADREADVLGTLGFALVLAGRAAAGRVLAALDGTGLAHVAAHGTFRADSPLFSALQLDDGPLTVYDLERLRRAPYRVIFSSRDSGVLAPAGADELLGLAHTLAPLGTAGIVASVVPVNDRATATLMVALHRHLRSGASLAEALRRARHGTAGEPVLAATAWSFLALGPA